MMNLILFLNKGLIPVQALHVAGAEGAPRLLLHAANRHRCVSSRSSVVPPLFKAPYLKKRMKTIARKMVPPSSLPRCTRHRWIPSVNKLEMAPAGMRVGAGALQGSPIWALLLQYTACLQKRRGATLGRAGAGGRQVYWNPWTRRYLLLNLDFCKKKFKSL